MRIRSAVIASVFTIFMGGQASAGIMLGADVFGAKYIGDGSGNIGIGTGVNGRIGYTLPVPILDLTPEVVGGYARFGVDNAAAKDASITFIRAMVGGRAAIGAGIKPFVYWHTGVSKSGATGTSAVGGVDLSSSSTGFTTEFGGGLDFTALPLVSFGIHGGYSYTAIEKTATNNGDAKWIEFGAHAQVGF